MNYISSLERDWFWSKFIGIEIRVVSPKISGRGVRRVVLVSDLEVSFTDWRERTQALVFDNASVLTQSVPCKVVRFDMEATTEVRLRRE